jgi:hypothetical protein
MIHPTQVKKSAGNVDKKEQLKIKYKQLKKEKHGT